MSTQTIINCFRKAGITPEAQNTAIADADEPFSDLKESLQQLHNIDSDMVPEGLIPMISDDDILRTVTTNQQEQSYEDDANDEEVEEAASEQPLRFQVESAIDVSRNATLYSSNGEEMSLVIKKFEKLFTEDRIAYKKQPNICDIFKHD